MYVECMKLQKNVVANLKIANYKEIILSVIKERYQKQ